MARINAGKYRHIVTFQTLKNDPNLYGEISTNLEENWVDTLTARVSIIPISGRELLALESQMRQGEISHRIVLRYMTGITSEMRIKFGNRIFDIISPPINSYENNKELLIFCKEREIQPTGVF
jgi:SPP1 family predicted phage head-tail adaptor